MRSRPGTREPLVHEFERLRDIESKLFALPATTGPAPTSQEIVHALADLLRCEKFMVHRPVQAGEAWRLGPRVSTDDPLFDAYDDAMGTTAIPFAYDPLHPAKDQQNRVKVSDEVHHHGPEETCIVEELWPRLGLDRHDQIRILVCDGPVLLGWVGGYRAEPFTIHDRALFASLVPSLQRSLALQRTLLDAQIVAAGLEAALEALGAPSFIARADGALPHASASGRALVERDPRGTRRRVREAITRRPAGTSVARLGAEGFYLVVLRENDGTLEGRLREAKHTWRLTPREVDVLRGVAAGSAGKEIALQLGIHPGSVERHMTSILRKARCDSRTRLVAKLWTGL